MKIERVSAFGPKLVRIRKLHLSCSCDDVFVFAITKWTLEHTNLYLLQNHTLPKSSNRPSPKLFQPPHSRLHEKDAIAQPHTPSLSPPIHTPYPRPFQHPKHSASLPSPTYLPLCLSIFHLCLDIESHLPSNGLSPQWRYTMYSTTHYHSTTHEVLCVYQGRAKLLFGGERNPGKVEAEVSAGDAIVVPAGVGHRLLEDYGEGGGFMMVGSYPKGCNWDMCYGKAGEEEKARSVEEVQWLEKDPLYGDDGPVLWSNEKLEERKKKKSEL